MCLTSGADVSTGEGILTAIDEAFTKNQIPWENLLCKFECQQHKHYDWKKQFHCFKILKDR